MVVPGAEKSNMREMIGASSCSFQLIVRVVRRQLAENRTNASISKRCPVFFFESFRTVRDALKISIDQSFHQSIVFLHSTFW